MDFSSPINRPQMASIIKPLRIPSNSKQSSDTKIGGFSSTTSNVVSLNFHPTNGKHLFVTSSNYRNQNPNLCTIRMHDCLENRPISSIKVPCSNNKVVVQATHAEYCCLIGGCGKGSNLEYLSLYDNKVLRTYSDQKQTEEGSIACLSMSPVDDTFLSADEKGSVRLWNASTPNCIGKLDSTAMNANGEYSNVLASFDSTGLVFCLSAKSKKEGLQHVHLYDARNYGAGAFAEMSLKKSDVCDALLSNSSIKLTNEDALELSGSDWSSIQFNSSGKHLLIGTKGLSNRYHGYCMTIDGYSGALDKIFMDDIIVNKSDYVAGTDTENNQNIENDVSLSSKNISMQMQAESELGIAACFTPDDKTVLVGGGHYGNGFINCHDAASGALTAKLEGHADRVDCIACSPRLAVVATACTNTALWTW